MIRLELTGKPEGKGRPRFGKGGRVYTPNATKLAEGRVIDAWTDADRPRIDGPVRLRIRLEVARPKGHFTSKGALNLPGSRLPFPTGKKPDLDNALKLVMDALNRRAYRDDVDVVDVAAVRVWAPDGWERTLIELEEITG
jgi:Holliday junction resolvase RusA-like endonuclease